MKGLTFLGKAICKRDRAINQTVDLQDCGSSPRREKERTSLMVE
jgi:hypothetical protein